MRAHLLPALVVIALSACGGRDLVPTSQASINLIATPQDPMVVRAAIIRALDERDFAVTGEEPGQIAAFWDHDEETIHVSIVYDGKHYDIHYVQATGFDIVQQPGGELYIDETYEKIVRRLAREVDEQLDEVTRPAPPAMVGPTTPAQAPAQTSSAPPASGTQPAAPSWQQFVPQIPTAALPAPPVVNIQKSHTHKEQTQSLHCCINGAYFECATQQAFESCITDGGASCARVPSKDGGC